MQALLLGARVRSNLASTPQPSRTRPRDARRPDPAQPFASSRGRVVEQLRCTHLTPLWH